MNERYREWIEGVGYPRIIISAFVVFLCISAVLLKLPTASLLSDTLVRFGMNGILVLAMVPSIQSGTGLNFGLALGIICGLLGAVICIEMDLTGFVALWASIILAVFFGSVAGYLYGVFLNRIKGSEMMVGTYVGYSVVSAFCIFWLTAPFSNPEMVWAIGGGLRTTIALESKFGRLLNNLWSFNVGDVEVPTGLILFFSGCCFIVWIFTKSKTGLAMKAAGENPRFAVASGINVDMMRTLGTMLSTVLGAVGIIIYAQSYGFLQLYTAPMNMSFGAVAAILIGGASATKAKISNVIVGALLFQALLTIALPVANQVIPEGNLSEVARVIISNGIILYALTKVGGE